jgi:aminopeptidase N
VDHPSDKARVAFDVTAPARYAVVANGRRTGRTTLPGGRARTRWQTDAPLPTKVMVIGVAAFAVVPTDTVAGVPVTSWVYPDDRAPGLADLAVTPRVLTFYAERLGAFPYAKLAGVQSTTRYGGMENASAVFYGERALADARRDDDLVAHEVAHQWFGDSVTEADWPHLWLSEGVATYLATRFLADAAPSAATGRARLRRRMARARRRVVRFARQAPARPLVDTLARDPRTLLNANSYQKGAWVLHMLHARLGDAAFWDGLRTYHRRHRHGTATTADLRRAMEAASGDTLAAFVRQWTRRPGHPVLSVTWAPHAGRDGAPGVRVTVRQTQRGAPFRFPLEVEATTADGPVRLTLPVAAARTATFTRTLPAAPTALALDPRVRLLFEGTARRE